ncbi:metallophosphoesterase [Mucilaginibacter pedocola]|uniref:Metallophosphoesterase n=1 Tax=Mucilaginibacter pedocola TaxID=1792845 RepID=A0A1S9P9B7_9SPHI|nr:metallophosphoesterase [Mucilaginibacter pedocola]OOQ57552.1 metallophosphoesterase [Mucilaginibacter pedocola]
MVIQYCSDLHLEFFSNREFVDGNPLLPIGEVLILAGDIVALNSINHSNSFFNYVSDNFRETYWVPGNHEYYHGDLESRVGPFTEKIRPNVTLMNNTVIEEENVQLIFSTLWSSIQPNMAWQIERGMNDFYQITNSGKRFDTLAYNELHTRAAKFLDGELSRSTPKKRVVVTHHVPTFRNYPPEYLGSALNQAFASNLDGLIETTAPDYWIFGHHHRNIPPFNIGSTTMLTNQLGYIDAGEHHTFNDSATITV